MATLSWFGQSQPSAKTDLAATEQKLSDLIDELGIPFGPREFTRWRRQFLRVHDVFLAQRGIDRVRRMHDDVEKSIDDLAKSILAVQKSANQGHISVDKASVRGRNSLNDMNGLLSNVVAKLHKFVPSRTAEEVKNGYTKYQVGALLVDNGFAIFKEMVDCLAILSHMREGFLRNVADKQILENIDYYENNVKRFCAVMADLGLVETTLKAATEHAIRDAEGSINTCTDDEDIDSWGEADSCSSGSSHRGPGGGGGGGTKAQQVADTNNTKEIDRNKTPTVPQSPQATSRQSVPHPGSPDTPKAGTVYGRRYPPSPTPSQQTSSSLGRTPSQQSLQSVNRSGRRDGMPPLSPTRQSPNSRAPATMPSSPKRTSNDAPTSPPLSSKKLQSEGASRGVGQSSSDPPPRRRASDASQQQNPTDRGAGDRRGASEPTADDKEDQKSLSSTDSAVQAALRLAERADERIDRSIKRGRNNRQTPPSTTTSRPEAPSSKKTTPPNRLQNKKIPTRDNATNEKTPAARRTGSTSDQQPATLKRGKSDITNEKTKSAADDIDEDSETNSEVESSESTVCSDAEASMQRSSSQLSCSQLGGSSSRLGGSSSRLLDSEAEEASQSQPTEKPAEKRSSKPLSPNSAVKAAMRLADRADRTIDANAKRINSRRRPSDTEAKQRKNAPPPNERLSKSSHPPTNTDGSEHTRVSLPEQRKKRPSDLARRSSLGEPPQGVQSEDSKGNWFGTSPSKELGEDASDQEESSESTAADSDDGDRPQRSRSPGSAIRAAQRIADLADQRFDDNARRIQNRQQQRPNNNDSDSSNDGGKEDQEQGRGRRPPDRTPSSESLKRQNGSLSLGEGGKANKKNAPLQDKARQPPSDEANNDDASVCSESVVSYSEGDKDDEAEGEDGPKATKKSSSKQKRPWPRRIKPRKSSQQDQRKNQQQRPKDIEEEDGEEEENGREQSSQPNDNDRGGGGGDDAEDQKPEQQRQNSLRLGTRLLSSLVPIPRRGREDQGKPSSAPTDAQNRPREDDEEPKNGGQPSEGGDENGGGDGQSDEDFIIFFDLKTGSIGKLCRTKCIDSGMININKSTDGSATIEEATTEQGEKSDLMDAVMRQYWS